ncbi:hypothetical protein BK011_06510 [Tenericutes bacterium MZ-XQ]|nr:hypothetical protein BK011_06510 [Tenericutes bacterium MZ-XQ]
MLYQPIKIRNLNLKNRIVMAPMCMYQSDASGEVKDFHITHYATRAMGGVGLIIQEATAIDPNGVISKEDLGIWNDQHVEGLKKIVHAIHVHGAKAGIQINHAGRKARVEHPVAPSAVPFNGELSLPREMTLEDIKKVISDFQAAARRALEAGYDLLELHAAHGYLLFQFLSPNSNKRTDAYQDRKKILVDVIKAVREVWPEEKTLAIRFSATEYVEEGVDPFWLSNVINEIKDLGVDIIDVSSGGNVVSQSIRLYPGYQLNLAKIIKEQTGLVTIGGGLIEDVNLGDYAISSGSCDMVFYGRLLLRDPYHFINHASDIREEIEYPKPYLRGRK